VKEVYCTGRGESSPLSAPPREPTTATGPSRLAFRAVPPEVALRTYRANKDAYDKVLGGGRRERLALK